MQIIVKPFVKALILAVNLLFCQIQHYNPAINVCKLVVFFTAGIPAYFVLPNQMEFQQHGIPAQLQFLKKLHDWNPTAGIPTL